MELSLLVKITIATALVILKAYANQCSEKLTRQKKEVELETAYVVRKGLGKQPHYAVVVGSSGKSVLGPELPETAGGEIHKVQGFIIKKDDDVETADDLTTFVRSALLTHNQYRMRHHAPALRWSKSLALQAQKIASDLLNDKEAETNKRNGINRKDGLDTVGENVEKFSSVEYGCDRAGFEATRRWYAQSENYSYNDPHVNDQTNSFTQLVWKDTKLLGMGCASRKGLLTNDIYVVALYSPPGNAGNAITRNVIRPGYGRSSTDLYSGFFRKK